MGVIFQCLFELLDLALGLGEFLLPDAQIFAPQADLAFPEPVFAMHRHMGIRCHGLINGINLRHQTATNMPRPGRTKFIQSIGKETAVVRRAVL